MPNFFNVICFKYNANVNTGDRSFQLKMERICNVMQVKSSAVNLKAVVNLLHFPVSSQNVCTRQERSFSFGINIFPFLLKHFHHYM